MPVSAHHLVEMTAIAIAVGILAQVVADRVRLPSIVFLLLFGVLVGPDFLGVVEPQAFGAGLRAIVTIAVAVILFEGGLQLHYVDVAAVGRAVRNLVTIGALVTVLGASVAAHLLTGLPWNLALLFGAIVSVTGPTVINPLLDRVHVKRRLDTVLRGEGILIDPIGAILAIVVFEWIATVEASIWESLLGFVMRMGIGVVIGISGGWLLGRVLRARGIISDELKNLVVLVWVLSLFAASEALAAESGLAAVVLAGMAVRRETIPQQSHLRRFKGELSVLFISLLFILLSAYVRLDTVYAIGWGGVLTVVVLMLVVRPLNVLASTWKSELSWRERLFVMWISPRGVVAISIASFVTLRLQEAPPDLVEAGLTAADGRTLLALVFLTIAITVVIQGLTAGLASRILDVHAEAGRRVLVIGANRLGRTVGTLLKDHGWEPLLIDTNSWQTAAARRVGLSALTGNSLDRRVLEEAHVEEATAVIAVTTNQEVNFIVARLAKDEYHVAQVYPVLVDLEQGPREDLVFEMGGELAFGRGVDVSQWNYDLRYENALPAVFTLGSEVSRETLTERNLPDGIVPVLTLRDGKASICHGGTQWSAGDRVVAIVRSGAEEEVRRAIGAVEHTPAPILAEL